MDVLDWHDNGCYRRGPKGEYRADLDQVQKNIEEIRNLVETEYPMLGVKEYHLGEWGSTMEQTGVGREIAFFYYMDLAGIHHASRALWTSGDLCGLLVSPKTPRTVYWAWKAYADGVGVRLVTDTNDRCVVALASRDVARATVRVLVARAKRFTVEDAPMNLPPVRTKVDFEGLPIQGEAEVNVLRLGPGIGPLWEEGLAALTTKQVLGVRDGKLTLVLDALEENQVCAVTVTPRGVWAKEEAEREAQKRHQRTAEAAARGVPLPHVILREGFETDFTAGETVFERRRWTHGANETSATTAYQGDRAHSGKWYAQFNANYWSNHEVVHPISPHSRGLLEVTAWMRFSEYEGNRNGKGFAQILFGLLDSPKRDDSKNHVTFQFGTNEQVSYARFNFASAGSRGIGYKDPSRLKDDVRGAWYQVGIVIDMESRTVTARHRRTAKDDWIVYYSGRYERMDWTPKYVFVSGYNQAPDWRLCVDDIEVTSSVRKQKETE